MLNYNTFTDLALCKCRDDASFADALKGMAVCTIATLVSECIAQL